VFNVLSSNTDDPSGTTRFCMPGKRLAAEDFEVTATYTRRIAWEVGVAVS
jgi:hypothetical protein